MGAQPTAVKESGGSDGGGRGRYLVPTALGLALIRGLQRCDPGLIEPNLRCRCDSLSLSVSLSQVPQGVHASMSGIPWW